MKVGQKFNVVEVKSNIYSEDAFKEGGWTIQNQSKWNKEEGGTLTNGTYSAVYKHGLYMTKHEVKLVGQLIVKILK